MNLGWFNLESVWGPPGRPLPRQKVAQLVGGPRDGEFIAIRDRVIRFYEPHPPQVKYVPEEGPIPVEALEARTREYVLKKWMLCFGAAPILIFVCDGHKLPGDR